jgi:cytochrome c biogenesis protein CcdA
MSDPLFLSLGLSFLAGVLSLLSPCVLPMTPVVLGTATQAGRMGPYALGLGLIVSFVLMGTILARLSGLIGIDPVYWRAFGAIIMIGLGLSWVSKSLQNQLSLAAGPLGQWANHGLNRLKLTGISGQFATGVTLGLVWTPCVGPVMGGAILLASQGKDLWTSAFIMTAYALGTVLPLMLMASLAQLVTKQYRSNAMILGQKAKSVLGWILVIVGVLILTDGIKIVEGVLNQILPAKLIELTARY